MKNSPLLKTLIIVIWSLTLISCTDSKKEINIKNAAFIYGSETEKIIEVSMKGEYDTKDHNFIGSLVIGDEIKLENVLFSSGTGLISYIKTSRSYLGQIFFDYQSLKFTIEITDQDLYHKLTKSNNDGNKKITITSPAKNIEEAKRINKELKDIKLPFEK
ncbi:hypothetical protein [Paenibacillus antarcticus]|uniref:Uncharacterized protein n=1 Tax=Paenibacillus antarcticus TaxID=253703 RepID=A0A168R1V3_9BACL|nr:hypothetical protein [Paenibacillus antarcticus]OAB48478.1 hypothetical protein PBAT_02265 [Paenibacillus antarcticus]